MSTKEAELQALADRLNSENNRLCDEVYKLERDLTAAKHSLDETTRSLAEATQRVEDLEAENVALRVELRRHEPARPMLTIVDFASEGRIS